MIKDVTFSRVSSESKVRFDRDVISRWDARDGMRNARVLSVSIVPDDVRERSHDDRPEEKRLIATQTPHKWDWVSAAFLGNPLSFSLHPPSFVTTLLLITLLLASPDRLTSAWTPPPLSAMGIERILEFHIEYAPNPIEFFGFALDRWMD